VAKQKKIPRSLSYALTGWIAGVVTTLVLGLSWPIIFPAIVRPEHYYGAGPGLFQILGIVLAIASPAALIGGLIGGNLSVEGGERGQRLIAIIFGIIFSVPCSGGGLWFFTGF
jgi:hypothetical protein